MASDVIDSEVLHYGRRRVHGSVGELLAGVDRSVTAARARWVGLVVALAGSGGCVDYEMRPWPVNDLHVLDDDRTIRGHVNDTTVCDRIDDVIIVERDAEVVVTAIVGVRRGDCSTTDVPLKLTEQLEHPLRGRRLRSWERGDPLPPGATDALGP